MKEEQPKKPRDGQKKTSPIPPKKNPARVVGYLLPHKEKLGGKGLAQREQRVGRKLYRGKLRESDESGAEQARVYRGSLRGRPRGKTEGLLGGRGTGSEALTEKIRRGG